MRKTLIALMFAAALPTVAMAMPQDGGPLGGPLDGPRHGGQMHGGMHGKGPYSQLDLTREQVRSALAHPRINVIELHSGQWIELGEQPKLYPVELGVPELPMLLNRLLKPIR